MFEGWAEGRAMDCPAAALGLFSERRSLDPAGAPQRPTRVCQLRWAILHRPPLAM